jgi:hypothetical protein
MKKIQAITVKLLQLGLLIGIVGLSACHCEYDKHREKHDSLVVNINAVDLKAKMQTLWIEHQTLTRNVIFCITDDLPGLVAVTNRMKKNHVAMANIIRPFWGDKAAETYTLLLNTHALIMVDVLKAIKVENKEAFAIANQKWTSNAIDLAVFLSTENSVLVLENMKMMLNEHLILTLDEAVQRVKQDYVRDLEAFDRVQFASNKMSNKISEGIIQQFPDKFDIQLCKTNQ